MFSQGSVEVHLLLKFNVSIEAELAADIGLRLMEHILETNNTLTINGTSFIVNGSYVYHSDPWGSGNITISKCVLDSGSICLTV